MDSTHSLVEQDAKAMEGSSDVGMTLSLGGGKSLVIGDKDLTIHGVSEGKNDKRSSNGKISAGKHLLNSLSALNCLPCRAAEGKGTQSISLYNILWAELVNDSTIVIDYAAPHKSSLKLEKLTLDISGVEPDSQPDSPKSTAAKTFVTALLSSAYGESKQRKRAYVLINPNSGPGASVHKWNKHVKPLFEAARMELEVVTLSKGGEATDLAEKVDLDKYDTIMALSGDGTPHEIFNGLAKRPDAKKALTQLAVSHIPCGSGNAFSLNCNGTNHTAHAALSITKGVVMPVDLVSVTQGDRRIVSFLSQAVGIIAESDLGTENMRWMGGTRFEVGLFMRIFKKKCYPMDLAVKLEIEDKQKIKQHYKKQVTEKSSIKADEADDSIGLPKLKYGTVKDELPEGWEMISYDKIGNFYCGNMAYMSADANFFPAALPTDGFMDLVTMNGDLSPVAATKALLGVESGKFFDSPNVTYKKISAYRLIPRNQENGYISIDGERVPWEPFQAEVHKGLGRVIAKRGVYEAAGPAGWEKA